MFGKRINRNKSVLILGIAAALSILSYSTICFSDSHDMVCLKKFSIAPVIDGKLDDQCWKGAAKINDFLIWKISTPARPKTSAYLGYDDFNLYIGFRCEGSVDKAEVTIRDKVAATEDHIEIFLDPNRDKENYYHLGVNAIGTQWDFLIRGGMKLLSGWDGPWQSAAFRGDGFWNAEVAIPFKSLSAAIPKEGEIWGLELGRRTVSQKEWSSWRAVFHQPGKFGYMIFGSYSQGIAYRLAPLEQKLASLREKIETKVSIDEEIWNRELDEIEKKLGNYF